MKLTVGSTFEPDNWVQPLFLFFIRNFYSPIEIQMRKNELQEQIGNLKKKHLTLTELNKELESQLVEVCRFSISVTVSHYKNIHDEK